MAKDSMFKILCLLALNVVFFWRTLKYGYAVDDFENARCGCKVPDIVKANTQRQGKIVEVEICKKCGVLKRSEPRHIWDTLLWSFGGISWIKGKDGEKSTTSQYTNKTLDHALVMILHNTNCILIYLAFGSNDVSFLTALMFAIHPTAMQGSSVWLSGKGYAAGLMFVLLSYWLAPIAPIFYAIGSFYVATLTMPLVFLKTPYWFWSLLLPLMFLLRRKNLKEAISFKYKMVSITRNPFHWHNIILVFKTIGYYLCQCIVPTKLGVHHEYMAMYGVTEKDTKECLRLNDKFLWIGVSLVISTTYLFFWHYSPIALGLFWFLVFIAPWSNWMAMVCQPVACRYATIALVGALYTLANIIVAYPIVCAIILTYYATIANQFMPAYENILKFAVYNVINFPQSFQGWLWKSDIERNFRLLERSFDSAMQAWILRPDDFLVNNNITTLLLMQRRFKEAEEFLKRMETSPMPNKEMENRRDIKVKAVRNQMNIDIQAMKDMLDKRNEIKDQGRNDLCKCGSGKKSKKCCSK